MQPGQPHIRQLPYPKRRLNPAFRDSIRLVMRDSIPGHALSLMVGIPQQAMLSEYLHRRFTATPLSMDRLQRLANLIGFEGELLQEEPEASGSANPLRDAGVG